MKTNLTLSAVLFSLTLAPAAFANGAQEQKPAASTPVPAAATATETEATGEVTSITRAVLQGLDLELRAELMNSLRESALGLLQVAAPALVETTVEAARDLTAR